MIKTRWFLLMTVLGFALLGCAAVTPTSIVETEVPPTLVQGVETQMPPAYPNPPAAYPNPNGPAGMEKLIDSARQDLAKRLSVAQAEITLIDVRAVTWGNSSLGCAQKGMVYSDVLTPGFLVILRSGNSQYEYHAGSDQVPSFCENPQAPSMYDPNSI